jgi:Ca-activated chloride channel family protein
VDCRLSPSTPKLGTTPPATSRAANSIRAFASTYLSLATVGLLGGVLLFSAVRGFAQNPQSPFPSAPPPSPPGQDTGDKGPIKVSVNLVILHTTVLDDRGRFAEGLKEENFRVFEDKAQQKLTVFKREDIPVSMGLVIDNSGSMREKRPRVNEAAITLVQASNKDDEAFVVNFNDDFYLDLDKDFSNSIPELKEALERIDSRGSTALYDAIIGSLDHLKKASKDKRVLLVVTDGEDNTSRNSLEKTIREIQRTNTVIYTIGLLGEENKKNKTKAKKALQQIATASGGLAFFPESVDDVHNICEQVAHDIRNQYTLGYYPSNDRQDGTYRSVQVDVIPPRGRGKLVARTRNGYYAPGGVPQSGK